MKKISIYSQKFFHGKSVKKMFQLVESENKMEFSSMDFMQISSLLKNNTHPFSETLKQ